VADIFHQWGSDLIADATGDIATAAGATLGQQRVLRRLLTNPGEYIWQPDYGAGLARFIGQPANAAQIRAVIRGQIFLESSVARSPEPVIDVQVGPSSVYVHIRYVDADTGETLILQFPVGG